MDKHVLVAKQMDAFVTLFHSIPTLYTFNRHWHGPKGSMMGVVTDENFRIILEHGQLAKTVDNFGRKVILLGTHFGLLAVYPTQVQASRNGVPTLSYCTTDALVQALSRYFETAEGVATVKAMPSIDRLADHEHFPFLDTTKLFELFGAIADWSRERFIYVGDGMKKATPKSKKAAKPVAAQGKGTESKPGQGKRAIAAKKQANAPKQAKPKTEKAIGDIVPGPLAAVQEEVSTIRAEAPTDPVEKPPVTIVETGKQDNAIALAA